MTIYYGYANVVSLLSLQHNGFLRLDVESLFAVTLLNPMIDGLVEDVHKLAVLYLIDIETEYAPLV